MELWAKTWGGCDTKYNRALPSLKEIDSDVNASVD
jgi:hypothetical protein